LSNQISREANAISAGPLAQLAVQRPRLFFARRWALSSVVWEDRRRRLVRL